MQKKTLLILSICSINLLIGQNSIFEKISGTSIPQSIFADFKDVQHGTVALADIDGDGDLDAIISGATNGLSTTKLYKNENRQYVEVLTTPFKGTQFSTITFADVDTDGDPDVLIAGFNNVTNAISTNLYSNDGNGNFTEVVGTPFTGVADGSATFFDIDNDLDLDLLITGTNGASSIAKLYTNDGAGSFTEVLGTPFAGVEGSSVAVADIDSDNDKDILISGSIGGFTPSTKLYKNNGSGTFTEILGTPFDAIENGSVEFADVDNDADVDLLISGRVNSFGNGTSITKLYSNDANGNFTEVLGTPFIGIQSGDVSFADIDDDNDLDLAITGTSNISNSPVTKLYTNNGLGNFTEVSDTPFEGVENSALVFADLDADQDIDLVILGRNSLNNLSTSSYLNDRNGNFTRVIESAFEGVSNSSIAFSDIDNDGDNDLFITGRDNNLLPVAKLYINDRGGLFSESKHTIIPLENGSNAFADIDGDNDDDLIISGADVLGNSVTELYINDGSGRFTKSLTNNFEDVRLGSLAFADIDNDGDPDLVISGLNNSLVSITKVYTNDGSGNFTGVLGNPLPGVHFSSIALADIDNDRDPDLLISGFSNTIGTSVTKLYSNNGSGIFTEILGTPMDAIQVGSVAFADIDNDQDKDLVISGSNSTSLPITKLYTNDGLGTFTEVVGTGLESVQNGAIAFSDADNDGDQDLLITGTNSSPVSSVANLYTNNGSGIFTKAITPLDKVRFGAVAFVDIDNDNDQDLIITGRNNGDVFSSKLYRNLTNSPTTSLTVFKTNPDNDVIGNNIDIESEIKLYPNPTNGDVTLTLENASHNTQITIVDLTGKTVHTTSVVEQSNIELNTNEFPKGVYFVKITTNNNHKTIRLIKL